MVACGAVFSKETTNSSDNTTNKSITESFNVNGNCEHEAVQRSHYT